MNINGPFKFVRIVTVSVLVFASLTACDNAVVKHTKNTQNTGQPQTQTSQSNLNVSAPAVVNANENVQMNATLVNKPLASFTWTQISGTTVQLKQADTSNPSFIAPDISKSENMVFEVKARFGTEEQIRRITIQVNPSGIQVDAGLDFNVSGGNKVTLHAAGSALNTPATYRWRQISGDSVGTVSDDNTDNPSFIAPIIGGVFEFEVKYTDAASKSAKDTVKVTVFGKPAPTLNAANEPIGFSGDTLTFKITTDASGPSYLWRQVSGPAVSLMNPATATPSFIAPVVTEETGVSFRVQVVSSEGLSSATYVTAIVKPKPSTSPLIIDAQAKSTITGGDTLQLSTQVTQTTAALTYLWQQVSGTTVVINNANQQNANVVMPKTAGDYQFKVTASDGVQSVSDVVNVTVVMPTIAIRWQTAKDANNAVETNTAVSLLAEPVNAKPPITYAWTQESGTSSLTLVNDDSANVHFTPAADGQYGLKVKMTDALGNVSEAQTAFVVMTKPAIIPAVAPPTNTLNIVVSGDTSAKEGELVQATVAISGQTGTPVVSWSKTAGPAISLLNAGTATVSFVAPAVIANTTITLEVQVTDGVTKTATIDIVVKDKPIVINRSPALTYEEGDTVPLSAAVSGGKPPYTYQWQADANNPNSVTLLDDTKPLSHFIAPAKTGMYNFSLTVTDSLANTATATQSMTILPLPLAPVPAVVSMAVVASPRHSVLEGELASANVVISNAKGAATYAWAVKSVSGGATLANGDLVDADKAVVSFTAPSVTADGAIELEVTVTDNDGPQKRSAWITVLNRQLTVTANPKTQNINSGQLIHLHADVSGSAKAPVTWLWTQTTGTSVTLANANTANPSFTATIPGHYAFAVTATDTLNNQGADSASLDVSADLKIDLGATMKLAFPSTYGQSKASIHATVTQGSGQYTYLWQVWRFASTQSTANIPSEIVGSSTASSVEVQLKECVVNGSCATVEICGIQDKNGKTICTSADSYVTVTVTDTVSLVNKTSPSLQVMWQTISTDTTPVVNASSSCKDAGNSNDKSSDTQYTAYECIGPVSLCEKLNAARDTPCPLGSLPGAYVKNNVDGTRIVEFGCIGVKAPLGDQGSGMAPELDTRTCQQDWFEKSSNNDKCTSFSLEFVYTNTFECTFCCQGAECNNPNPTGCPVMNLWKP